MFLEDLGEANSAILQVMAWPRIGAKLLPEPMTLSVMLVYSPQILINNVCKNKTNFKTVVSQAIIILYTRHGMAFIDATHSYKPNFIYLFHQ